MPSFHALTFVDLLGKDAGLLVLHPGTQWFRRDEKGAVSNLLMREWESHFTREYGWPLYVEYHHALLPHDGKLSNSDRLRAAKDFTHPLLTHVAPPQQGDQPTAKSFADGDAGGRAAFGVAKEAEQPAGGSRGRSRGPPGARPT